jgi:hypothetical protein
MLLTFENHYVVAVVIFMVSMLFCKNLLECIQACVQLSQSLICKDLMFCPCLYKSHAQLLRESVFKLLLGFSIFQPIVLLVVKKIAESTPGQESLWTVNVGYVQINANAFAHSTNHTATNPGSDIADIGITFQVSEIDVVIVVMPYMLAAASSTWMWVSLEHQDFFQADPEWGPELFADQRMLLYELLYCFELFALACALLVLTADPAPTEYVVVYSLLLSFLILFFCAQSHQPRCADQAEHTISMLVFSILTSLVCFFVVQHWAGGCPTKRSSGLILLVVVLTLAILHMSTREDTRAGTVILIRTVISSACSLYFVVLASQNPNSWCLQPQVYGSLAHQR